MGRKAQGCKGVLVGSGPPGRTVTPVGRGRAVVAAPGCAAAGCAACWSSSWSSSNSSNSRRAPRLPLRRAAWTLNQVVPRAPPAAAGVEGEAADAPPTAASARAARAASPSTSSSSRLREVEGAGAAAEVLTAEAATGAVAAGAAATAADTATPPPPLQAVGEAPADRRGRRLPPLTSAEGPPPQ